MLLGAQLLEIAGGYSAAAKYYGEVADLLTKESDVGLNGTKVQIGLIKDCYSAAIHCCEQASDPNSAEKIKTFMDRIAEL